MLTIGSDGALRRLWLCRAVINLLATISYFNWVLGLLSLGKPFRFGMLAPQGFKDIYPNESDDFSYDAYGNMKEDNNKGISSIIYNHMNLPVKITFSGENKKIEYLYNAAGVKLKKTVTDGSNVMVVDYLSGFQYKGGRLEFFPTAEGYVRNTRTGTNNNYNYVYQYKDHLGNVRVSFTAFIAQRGQPAVAEIMEENHYYPFGLRHMNYNMGYLEYQAQGGDVVLAPPPITPTGSLNNNYKYNGKELQDELGLNLYDYGARNYDPALGRWMNIDPLAEKYYHWTPYNYTINNPISHIDPDGRDIENITGGVKFTGSDAITAFKAISRQVDNGGVKGFHFVYESRTPTIYQHTLNSFKKGKPNVLHYDSDMNERDKRRKKNFKDSGLPTKKGFHRDEYPYASTLEGVNADVIHVPETENRSQGGSLGRLYDTLESGDAFLVFPVPKDKEMEPERVPLTYRRPVPVNNDPIITPRGVARVAGGAVAAYIIYKIVIGIATWECAGCGAWATP